MDADAAPGASPRIGGDERRMIVALGWLKRRVGELRSPKSGFWRTRAGLEARPTGNECCAMKRPDKCVVRPVIRLCAFGLLAVAAMAPQADAWLNSADPRLQAWGAYMVLRERRTEAIPTLLAMLARYQVVEEISQAEVLDALIQLGVDVPTGDAQRIYPEFPVQSLILLSRSPEDTAPALLAIFKSAREPAAWLAAGNLLLQRRADGFAAAIVESMTVHALVGVTEPNTGGGFGGADCAAGWQGRRCQKPDGRHWESTRSQGAATACSPEPRYWRPEPIRLTITGR